MKRKNFLHSPQAPNTPRYADESIHDVPQNAAIAHFSRKVHAYRLPRRTKQHQQNDLQRVTRTITKPTLDWKQQETAQGGRPSNKQKHQSVWLGLWWRRRRRRWWWWWWGWWWRQSTPIYTQGTISFKNLWIKFCLNFTNHACCMICSPVHILKQWLPSSLLPACISIFQPLSGHFSSSQNNYHK